MLAQHISTFVSHLQQEKHMNPLLKEPFLIKVESDKESVLIKIENSIVTISQQLNEKPMITITGDCTSLLNLFLGKDRLKFMIDRSYVSVKGTYRHILRLESIFHCSSFKEMSKIS